MLNALKGSLKATWVELVDHWRIAMHVGLMYLDVFKSDMHRRLRLRLVAIDRIKAKHPKGSMASRFLEKDLPHLRQIYFNKG